MGINEGADDPGEFRLPLPQQDRLWRHPSEIGALAAAGALTSPDHHARRSWGVAVFSAVGGALAVSALWLTLGFDPQIIRVTNHVASQPLTTEPPRAITVDEWARELEAAARPAAIGIAATAGSDDAVISGVAYLDDGHLLTAAAALDATRGASVAVELADGAHSPGTVLGIDAVSGLAVVGIDTAEPMTVATTARRPVVAVGDDVLVVGHRTAIMANVITFDHAMRDAEGELRFEVFGLEGSFTPDLLGSAVVDSSGSVIGVVTDADGAHGYALAADTAREVADQLIANGEVSHDGWIGLSLLDVPETMVAPFAQQPFITEPLEGAVEVQSSVEGSPCEALSAGDWIIRADDRAITSRAELGAYIRSLEPGTPVTLVVLSAPLQNLDGTFVRTPSIHEVVLGARPPSDR